MTRLTVVFIILLVILAISCRRQKLIRYGMTPRALQNYLNEHKHIFYPYQIVGYNVRGQSYYAAILIIHLNSFRWHARYGIFRRKFETELENRNNMGYKLHNFDVHSVGKNVLYAAIWIKNKSSKTSNNIQVFHGITERILLIHFNRFSKTHIPTHISVYSCTALRRCYSIVWETNSNNIKWSFKFGMTNESLESYSTYYTTKGYTMTLQKGYSYKSNAYFVAIWTKERNSSHSISKNELSHVNFKTAVQNQFYRGNTISYLSVYNTGRKTHFAAIWLNQNIWSFSDLYHIDHAIQTFMKQNKYKGSAVAITKNGKLIYAQGYGKVNVKDNLDSGPRNLWRIASVSKPITSAAILTMMQQNKLKLTDKVFGPGSLLGTKYGNGNYEEYVKDITVKHLLQHTAGGHSWNNDGRTDGTNDPTYMKRHLNRYQLIRWVLNNVKPSSKPGTKFTYSNFGYLLLGRIIEEISGMTYEKWVQKNILKRCGITDMWIGGDAKSGKRHNEVIYYDTKYNPYYTKLNRADSNGGWIASSIDIARFLVHVDGYSTNTNPEDILSPKTLALMLRGSLNQPIAAMGWFVFKSKTQWQHTGRSIGSRAFVIRTPNGYTFSFLANGETSDNIEKLAFIVINGIKNPPQNINFF